MPRELTVELIEAGKRASDTINGVLTFSGDTWGLKDKWMGFSLQDGSSRGEIFDSIIDAKRFYDEDKTWFLCLGGALQGLTARDCSIMLQFHREARDAGMGQSNPKAQPFMSTAQSDMRRTGLVRPQLWTPN